MSYVVLARKWRPRFFEEVVGQSHVARTLKNSIEQDRVAHSYLFTGARGVGKTSTARILAKALNCEKGPTTTPCYECTSCLEISQGQSVDVFEIDGASNRGINEIRELREGARYAPSKSRFKIYIIDEVHMLTTEAFNALLKTLEEPPPHVKFIFATTEPQKIPVTILSRCQRFDFKRISQHDIVEHLLQICPNEGIEAEEGALQLIARQASGGMRDALSLLDQVISFAGNHITEEQVTQILGVANRTHLFELSRSIVKGDAQQALLTLDEVHRYGYDLQQFSSEMVNHMRDLMVVKVVQNPERVTTMTQSEIDVVLPTLKQVTTDLLHRYFSVMIEGAQEMSRSPYPKLIFEMTLVRMCQLEPLVGLDLLIDKLHALEGSLDDVPLEPMVDSKKKIESRPVVKPATPAPSNPTPPPVQASPTPAPSPEPKKETPSHVFTADDPSELNNTPLDDAISAAPSPTTTQATPQEQPDEPAPATPEPIEHTDEDESNPDFEQLDEELERLAMEAEEEDMLGLDSEEHENTHDESMRYEVFSLTDTERNAVTQATALAPDEESDDEDDAQIPLPELDIAKDGRQDSWKKIVDYIRLTHAPLAATLEHAYIEELTEQHINMTFAQRYSPFVHDDKRLSILKEYLHRVLGDDFNVNIGTRFDDKPLPGFETLAQLRDIELRQRRDTLADDTENHPVIKEALELFSPSASRIMVALYED